MLIFLAVVTFLNRNQAGAALIKQEKISLFGFSFPEKEKRGKRKEPGWERLAASFRKAFPPRTPRYGPPKQEEKISKYSSPTKVQLILSVSERCRRATMFIQWESEEEFTVRMGGAPCRIFKKSQYRSLPHLHRRSPRRESGRQIRRTRRGHR